MSTEVLTVDRSTAGRRWRAFSGVSVRAALIAGVTAVGIAAAVPNGPTVPQPVAAISAAEVAGPRVSYQDVDLMAYIPLVTDLAYAVNNAAIAVDNLATAIVEFVATVTAAIPIVRVLAPQMRYFFYYMVEPLTMYPINRGALFVATQNPIYLVEIVQGIATCLTAFVRAQTWYFLEGGFLQWLGVTPMSAALTLAAPELPLEDSLVGAKLVDTTEDSQNALTEPLVTDEDPSDQVPVEPAAALVDEVSEVAELTEVSEVAELVLDAPAPETPAGSASEEEDVAEESDDSIDETAEEAGEEDQDTADTETDAGDADSDDKDSDVKHSRNKDSDVKASHDKKNRSARSGSDRSKSSAA